jgi:hypothetical protein
LYLSTTYVDFGKKADDASVAWALENCLDDLEVIQTWPGGGNSKITHQQHQQRRSKWLTITRYIAKGSHHFELLQWKDPMGLSS